MVLRAAAPHAALGCQADHLRRAADPGVGRAGVALVALRQLVQAPLRAAAAQLRLPRPTVIPVRRLALLLGPGLGFRTLAAAALRALGRQRGGGASALCTGAHQLPGELRGPCSVPGALLGRGRR